MSKWLLSVIMVFILGISSNVSLAFNENFLTYSPVSYFTKEDIKLYVAAKDQALNHASDGQKVSWSNPKSGSYGYFIPTNTTVKNGLTCRQVTIFNVANKVPGKSTYHVCKINNVWKVIS